MLKISLYTNLQVLQPFCTQTNDRRKNGLKLNEVFLKKIPICYASHLKGAPIQCVYM